MSKIRLILIALILIEVFIFKSKHFIAVTMAFGEFLEKYLSDAIMDALNK